MDGRNKMKRPNYVRLASSIDALRRCSADKNKKGIDIHEDNLKAVMDTAPSGSGLDSGIRLGIEQSRGERVVLYTSFHHMDEYGGYNGWTEHSIKITPSLRFGFMLKITGINKNRIKDYLYDVFEQWLNEETE